jgi:molybdopterin converting factor small subunit
LGTGIDVTVRFTGLLRCQAGCGNLVLSLDEGATLGDALLALRHEVPEAFARQVLLPMSRGEPSAALLLLNRTLVATARALDRSLASGDVVAFVTPADGG